MKTRTCKTCGIDLPTNSYSTLQSRICSSCKRTKELKKALEKKEKELTRLTVKKAKTKTVLRVSDLKKKVQKAFNKWIRERDKELPCISCGKFADNYDCGHFIAQGSSGALRYNTLNCSKQCKTCNLYKHGNLLEYRINLVKKIGLEKVEWLEEHRHDTKRWQREELLQVLEDIKQKTKELNESSN